MAIKETILYIDMDTAAVEDGAKAISGALGGLERTVKRLSGAVAAAFALDYLTEAAKGADALQKEFLVMRLALGKLKAALGDALAPIGQVLLPLINKAVFAAIRLVKYLGGIIRGLLGVDDTMASVTQSTEKAGKAARTLAGFDQVTRLGEAEGSTVDTTLDRESQKLDLWQKLIISKIQTLLEPLKNIDLGGAVQAFGELREALEPITREVFSGLEWAWYNLLIPLAQWTAGEALPAFLEFLTAALGVLDKVIQVLRPHAQWLWQEYLQPLARWTGDAVIAALGWLTEKLNALSRWIMENQELVQDMTAVAAAFLAVWAVGKIGAWLAEANELTKFFVGLGLVIAGVTAVFPFLSTAAENAWEGIRTAFGTAGEWFKDIANGIIGFVNGLLAAVTKGINAIIAGINQLSVTVPDWVPGVGGKRLGFSLKQVSAPQIPYLAKGAVLPANRPFLAMVGDQRHGTNVEAPLATIQEAVALVMEDQTNAIMAGFEASVGVQREILEAVLGIRIGDAVIARAAERYQRKMAVVRGGRV